MTASNDNATGLTDGHTTITAVTPSAPVFDVATTTPAPADDDTHAPEVACCIGDTVAAANEKTIKSILSTMQNNTAAPRIGVDRLNQATHRGTIQPGKRPGAVGL